jgi:hypothetical protein
VKYPKLAGNPNPKATPMIKDDPSEPIVFGKLGCMRNRDDKTPNSIHKIKNFLLVVSFSITLAPIKAATIAPEKCIVIEISVIVIVKMLKASEYHVNAFETKIRLTSAERGVTPNTPRDSLSGILRFTIFISFQIKDKDLELFNWITDKYSNKTFLSDVLNTYTVEEKENG